MKMSNHAAKRWFERFPMLDIVQQWEAARRPSKRVMKMLQATNRRCRAARMGKVPGDGRYYLVSPDGVVFVVGNDLVVITVLDMANIRAS